MTCEHGDAGRRGFEMLGRGEWRERRFGVDQRRVAWRVEFPALGEVLVSFIDPAPDTMRPECLAFRVDTDGIVDCSEIAASYDADPETAFAAVARDLAEIDRGMSGVAAR